MANAAGQAGIHRSAAAAGQGPQAHAQLRFTQCRGLGIDPSIQEQAAPNSSHTLTQLKSSPRGPLFLLAIQAWNLAYRFSVPGPESIVAILLSWLDRT